jgi:DNA ligase-1
LTKIEAALNAFEELERFGGRLSKLDILVRNSTNDVFRYLLFRTYNPFMVYNLKKIDIPATSVVDPDYASNYELFIEILNKLMIRELTGNEAKDTVRRFLAECSELEQKWYVRVLQKDLNVGIQAKTINEAIPDLIPVFSPMLAHPHEDRKTPKRFIIQPKLDGMRVLGDAQTGVLCSRKGKGLEGFDELQEEVAKISQDFFIDGEIMTSRDFNHLMTQAFRKSQGKKAVLNVFDLIPKEDFYKGRFNVAQIDRTSAVRSLLEEINSPLLIMVESSPVLTDFNEAQRWYERFLAEGYEGAMMKDAEAPYECKRSWAWQKLKPTDTYDLPVIAIEPGEEGTKYEFQVGRLVCLFQGNEVRIGSGLTDIQRQLWWDHPELIIGKTIEVIAQEVTNNQSGTHSLRFPRFKRVREDK